MILKKIDVFISHAWREHDQWLEIVKTIDKMEHYTWRNYSVPWHDPALHPSRPLEYGIIETIYKTQISPSDVVILIVDLYESKGSARWADKTIEFAKKFNKPLYGIRFKPDISFQEPESQCIDVMHMSEEVISNILNNHSTSALFKYV